MPNAQPFDSSPETWAALSRAAQDFARRLGAGRALDRVERIEVTLSGRGPIERLFAVEAALVAHWPADLRRPPRDLVSSTGELARDDEQSGLTLRALGAEGAVVLREVYDLRAWGAALKRAEPAHG